jgi:hypothetical protein
LNLNWDKLVASVAFKQRDDISHIETVLFHIDTVSTHIDTVISHIDTDISRSSSISIRSMCRYTEGAVSINIIAPASVLLRERRQGLSLVHVSAQPEPFLSVTD